MVLDTDGQPLEGCLFGAAGMDGSPEYQSLVIYHHNSPSWAETVRLAIPIDKFYGSHVRFEFRHCSSKFRWISVKRTLPFHFFLIRPTIYLPYISLHLFPIGAFLPICSRSATFLLQRARKTIRSSSPSRSSG